MMTMRWATRRRRRRRREEVSRFQVGKEFDPFYAKFIPRVFKSNLRPNFITL